MDDVNPVLKMDDVVHSVRGLSGWQWDETKETDLDGYGARHAGGGVGRDKGAGAALVRRAGPSRV